MSLRTLLCIAVALVASTVVPVPAASQGAPLAVLRGTVADTEGHGLGGASVSLSGPTTRETRTDAAGAFRFEDVVPGVYALSVSKAGFQPTQSTVTLLGAAPSSTQIQLAPSSLSSIAVIGRTSTSAGTSAVLNTTTASLATVTSATFVEQGYTNVNRVLNEVPGLVVSPGSIFAGETAANNGASPLAVGIPILRGSLPYETASLIDGHPINLGVYGTFNPAFLNAYVLQNVEVVKGPGASATNINYAIGGTVNFRTLEPTRERRESLDFGVDQFGGKVANLRATGTLGTKFGYALDYVTQGTNGDQAGWDTLNPLINLGPGTLINGQVVCGNPNAANCSTGFVSTNTSTVSSGYYTTPLALCCSTTPLYSDNKNELAKFRFNVNPTTSLTFTYLGGQQLGAIQGGNLSYLPQYYFQPPTNYTGALPYNTNIPNFLQGDDGITTTNVNLYQVEARGALGALSLNARYYAATVDSFLDYAQFRPQVGLLWGGVPLDTSLTPTLFNGTPVSVTFTNRLGETFSFDKLGGFTFQATLPIGPHLIGLSYDTVSTKTSGSTIYPGSPSADQYTVPAGSGQSFQTIALQTQLQLGTHVQANLSDYATLYTDHYTQDFGQTFVDSTHAYNAPRLGLSWRPSRDDAVRAAVGYSIAPPYINLLTNSAPTPNLLSGTSYFTVRANSGDIQPETAFGWDFGLDHRIGRDAAISVDIYQTLVRNQFLNSTSLAPAPLVITPGGEYVPGSFPLYVTKTQNLGHSQYQGLELALHRDPAVGPGFKLQGALMRAYAYALPPSLYATAAGPYTTNLGILPNENFQTSGNGYNSISFTRVPYSQGYAELNYRWRNGAFLLAGVTYYGPNNAYNEPPFGVVNASFRQPLGANSSLLLAVTNATSAYSGFAPGFYGGVPTPLANGMLGSTPANVYGPSTASLTYHVAF